MRYRPEIDGLRAVAVIAVMFFHAGFECFSGGFAGVDIFFVISGYLIGSLIYQQLIDKQFKLVTFYERRCRRILPALFLVMIVTTPFASVLLPPDDLKNFAQSLVAVTTFSSNVLFWLESGYFDTASELKPMLHTWSLAIEEQFYLLFPLFMIAIWRVRSHLVVTLFVLICLSLSIAQIHSVSSPSSVFFLLPFRAWELLLGVLTGIIMHNNNVQRIHIYLCQCLSLVGMCSIIASFILLTSRTPFPGLYALPPTVGTVLVIAFTTPKTFIYRFLTLKPMLFMGLISYSTYLWHQPIFALVRSYSLSPPSPFTFLMLIAVSSCLAAISWKFLEQPFRNNARISRRCVFLMSTVIACILMGIGVYGHFNTKTISHLKFKEESITIPLAFSGIVYDGHSCSFPEIKDNDVCEIPGRPDVSDSTVFILGDSLARVLSEALLEQKDKYRALVDLSSSGCPFLLDVNVYVGRGVSERCTPEYQNQRLKYIKQHPAKNKLIIVVARWPVYFLDDSFDNTLGGVSFDQQIAVAQHNIVDDDQVKRVFFNSLEKSMIAISEVSEKVVIVTPGYSNGWNVIDRALRISSRFDDSTSLFAHLELPLEAVQNRTKDIDSFMQSLSHKYHNIFIVDTTRITCDKRKGVCLGGRNGQFYFTDDLHPALFINRKIMQSINLLLNE